MAYFLSGLHSEIRRDVIAQSPTSLLRAVALAKLYEERHFPRTKPSHYNYTPKQQPTQSYTNPHTPLISRTQPKQNLPPLLPTPPHLQPRFPTNKPTPIRKISPAEMQLRRDKGLCYFCDEKFTFNHKCANKQLLMLMTKEEEIATHPEPEPPDPIQHAKEPNSSDHHLSLNALKGVTGIGNIRFTAQLHGSIIQVLADGGSSDNFVQP